MINIKIAFLIHTCPEAIYHDSDSYMFPLAKHFVASNQLIVIYLQVSSTNDKTVFHKQTYLMCVRESHEWRDESKVSKE